ncbi:hypothetical protein [Mycobacterium camsae]|nr:hypothetical protein [Mycobacterium gordonae]
MPQPRSRARWLVRVRFNSDAAIADDASGPLPTAIDLPPATTP